jgi:uncharacterized protein involved in outer membrane biogenesis
VDRSWAGGRALRIALAALAALALVIGAVLAYLLLDTNRLRGPLARLISERTGRDFTISGDLSLRLGRQLSLSASGLELANAEWASDPVMVTVDLLELTVEAASLVEGPLLIDQLRISRARVSLEQAADGSENWHLFEGDEESDSGFAFAEGLPLVLRHLDVDGALVTYLTPQRSAPLRFEIVSLEQRADAEGFLELEGRGVLEDRPIRIEGGIGPFGALLEARGFRHELAIAIGDTEVRSRGSVGDLAELEDIELVFDVREPDADFYADLLGVPGALTGPIEFAAVLSPNRPGIRVEVSGTFGGFDLALSGKVEQPRAIDGLEMEAHVGGPDLAVVGEVLELPTLPAGPFDLAGGMRRSGGSLSIREATLRAGDAELTVDAEFDELPDLDGGTAVVKLRGSDLGRFAQLLGPLPGLIHQPFEATATLTQRGEGEEHLEASIGVGENRFALEGIALPGHPVRGRSSRAGRGGSLRPARPGCDGDGPLSRFG